MSYMDCSNIFWGPLGAKLLCPQTLIRTCLRRTNIELLRQFQAVGYNSVEAEDWEIATRGEDIGKLETLLLDKNRKMEHELTQVKV